ncbi:hypothetical protein JL722_13231 [Aureococcus anophagefferens]|nr:hypothetical protein JL722_13231 [Aureococcus anophagefferens]
MLRALLLFASARALRAPAAPQAAARSLFHEELATLRAVADGASATGRFRPHARYTSRFGEALRHGAGSDPAVASRAAAARDALGGDPLAAAAELGEAVLKPSTSAGRFIGRGAGATRAARPMAPARRHGGGGTVYEIGGKEFSTEQVVGGVFTFYCVLAFVGTRGGKKEEKVEAATGGASTGGVMSMMDDGFDAWASAPANMKKWEESIAAMK